MPRHGWSPHAVLSVALLASGCGGTGDTPGKADDKTTAWRIDVVTTSSGAAFGARIMLNGEQVYLEPNAAGSRHSVDVTRPYVAGQNLVEVEIVSATMNPAVYGAAAAARVSPNGPALIADGIPWTLSVGERLFLRVPLGQ
jgi:hypothetical protein